jgi:hypothetical protein
VSDFWLSVIQTVIAVAGALVSVGGLLFFYFKKKITKQHERDLTETFENIVTQLASDNEVEKFSAAILLRKFFDKKSPFGVGNAPLAKDAVNVISSLLRVQPTGDFQKILADSLRYAPSLKAADLQYTNLTNAFLGKEDLDFSEADFFRANLTNATFKDKNGKGVNLQKAVFYETILENTNFKGCDLEETEFIESSLENANFKNANLKNTLFVGCNLKDAKFNSEEAKFAKFEKCRNIPENIKEYIQSSKDTSNRKKKIFISHPRVKTNEQQWIFDEICKFLTDHNFEIVKIEKSDEQNHAVLRKIKLTLEKCDAALVFNFKQFEIEKGIYRKWDEKEKTHIENQTLSTLWIYVETGIALGFGLPVFVIGDTDFEKDIFKDIVSEGNILKTLNMKTETIKNKKLIGWLNEIKNRSAV